MNDVLWLALGAVVVLSWVWRARKGVRSAGPKVVTRRTVSSPAELESLLENEQVREQLSKAGLDPVVFEQQLHSGEAHLEDDGTVVVEHVERLPAGSAPPGPLKDLTPLPPDQAVAFFQRTGMAEDLRKAGEDPDAFLAKLRTGEATIAESHATFRTVIGEDTSPPPAPAPAPPSAPLGPPSDDGDAVWKKGEL
jgi:hypothetical protein